MADIKVMNIKTGKEYPMSQEAFDAAQKNPILEGTFTALSKTPPEVKALASSKGAKEDEKK